MHPRAKCARTANSGGSGSQTHCRMGWKPHVAWPVRVGRKLRNLALGENEGGRSDEMMAALRKEGIELESNTKPFTLSNQKMTDKTYWTELLIKILAAERRVDSQDDDARAVQNDD